MSLKVKPLLLALAIILALGFAVLTLSKDSETWTLEDYKSQEIKWRDCYDGYQCTSFKVPVDYEKVDNQSFSLKVLRHSALDQKNKLNKFFVELDQYLQWAYGYFEEQVMFGKIKDLDQKSWLLFNKEVRNKFDS